jgi:hypothetical protein
MSRKFIFLPHQKREGDGVERSLSPAALPGLRDGLSSLKAQNARPSLKLPVRKTYDTRTSKGLRLRIKR